MSKAELITQVEDLLKTYEYTTSSKKRAAIKKKLKAIGKEVEQDEPEMYPEYFLNEFKKSDLVSGSEEFVLSPNQVFLKKWLSPNSENNSVLLFHGVGVGKTCTSIQIAENFKDMFKQRALIIVPKNLKANYKRQLFNVRTLVDDNMEQCTGNEYLKKIPNRAMQTSEHIEKSAMRLIKQRYQFLGRGEFVTAVEDTDLNPERIRALFSDRVIVCDEVHNLRMSSDSTEKKAPALLKLVLEHATNVKLVLMSATPMFNEADEIFWIMDLVSTNEKRTFESSALFGQNGKLMKKAKETIAAFSRRYVSYMRGDNPVTFPARLYPIINGYSFKDYPSIDAYTNEPIPDAEQIKYLELVASKMSKYQQTMYMKLQDDSLDPEMMKKIQLSNIIFPTKSESEDVQFSIGDAGFESCFESLEKKHLCVRYRDWVLVAHGEFLAADGLNKFCPKIETLINYVRNAEGVVFIYSRYVWAGIIPIAIALEHAGFGRFGGNHLLDNGKSKGKAGSYTILSSDEQRISPQKEQDIQTVSSKENVDGSVIKVVLVSDVGSEGIDFKNIREVHIMEPWFNMNKIEQIIGRGVRNDAHRYLPEEMRNCTIYHHVNMLAGKNAELESIDFRMYRISENKQKQISQVERVMKENAIDCALNHDVLVYNDGPSLTIKTSQGKVIHGFKRIDAPYSRQCDMSTCSLKCSVALPQKPSAPFYRPSVLGYEVKKSVKRMVRLFALKKMWTREEIASRKELREVNEVVFEHALAELLKAPVGHGRVILRSGAYLYQSNDIEDTKITVQDRELSKMPKVKNVPIREDKTAILLPQNEDIGDFEQKVIGQVEDMRKLIAGLDEPNDTVWDMVADRMSDDDVFRVAAMQTRATGVRKIHQALKRAGIFHGTDRIEFIYLDNRILCYHENKWQDCEAMQHKRYSRMLDAYLAGVIKGKTTIDVRGFLESKKGETKFKLLDKEKHQTKKNSRQGSVCVATTSYSIENMRQRIGAVVEDAESKLSQFTALNKLCLCNTYEYWLRRASSDGKTLTFFNKVGYILYKNLPQKI